MTYGPIARIVLRYIVGGLVLGSATVGERLASDPDIVLAVGMAIGAAVEGGYALAKRNGWAT